ncbi:protein Njmu-R1-like [Uloborus diversus]|uniref:protein Njmu-R1-like n=1 Tax=Uloborus diversus TaxID=327109 RepID=UPI00240A401E|nr:protein Njmu-R1-like [Uloborus diversus]
MSASCSSESSDTKLENSPELLNNIDSRYALYLFSNNKHASNTELKPSSNESVAFSKHESKADSETPAICLSLLQGNLNAEQETVVRCYLLKTLSGREDLRFENEGKYATLQFSDDSSVTFGCYYHRLSKHSSNETYDASSQNETSSKLHTFFICLIGPSNGVMDSFCPELGIYCQSLISLLDHEGQTDQEQVQAKLKNWYIYCIEYISRCVKNFKDDLAIVLQTSLWGNVDIKSDDEDLKWDLERLVQVCSLMPKSTNMLKDFSCLDFCFKIEVNNGKILMDKTVEIFPYCLRWLEKLKACLPNDHVHLHSILEGFRLSAIQDINTLKRLLQKAKADHYSLYKAFQFLQASGCEDILLFHVKHEANVTNDEEALEIISCLQECLRNKKASSV